MLTKSTHYEDSSYSTIGNSGLLQNLSGEVNTTDLLNNNVIKRRDTRGKPWKDSPSILSQVPEVMIEESGVSHF